MLLYRFFRFLLAIICKIYFHLEVKGKEYIPKNGGFVLASNHASFLDPIVLGVACPRILNFAARDSLFKNHFFGGLILRVGAFPVKRWAADLSAVRESVRRLRDNRGLVVFPEGTRSEDGKLQPITQGFVLLAVKANAPIIPAWISGSYKAWAKAGKVIKPVKLKVIFGHPVQAVKGQSYADVAQGVFRRIEDLSKIY